jgi:hypothetical protein
LHVVAWATGWVVGVVAVVVVVGVVVVGVVVVGVVVVVVTAWPPAAASRLPAWPRSIDRRVVAWPFARDLRVAPWWPDRACGEVDPDDAELGADDGTDPDDGAD